MADLVLKNAQIIGPTEIFKGTVLIRDGVIADIHRSPTVAAAIDLEDDYLLPGFIDVHTDNLEKHAMPRAGVFWRPLAAALAHDAAMVAAGTTTVFDALCVGSVGDSARRALLPNMMGGVARARNAGLLRADHKLHLRCDLVEADLLELVGPLLDDPTLRFVTFLDDSPQWDLERCIKLQEYHRKLPRGTLKELLPAGEREDWSGANGRRERLVEMCRARAIPCANHDDTRAKHIDEAVRLGLTIEEFPITMEAAQAAQQANLTIICGAPNVVNGGSHFGNVSVQSLVMEGMVDVLCSDYIPASLLQAIFVLAEQSGGPMLHEAVGMATSRPAELFALTDRGRIEAGMRADLIRVALVDNQPVVKTVWREGTVAVGPGIPSVGRLLAMDTEFPLPAVSSCA